ncbi:phage tail sheath family protein [Paenibacillus ferrarius]|uniref:phage tail sheath family protein n=1 Tax=Paenibacillus ferrarius TaxID=1469647 RepID=UPI003D268EB7
MAGGTWTAQNKVRPGSYFNFSTSGTLGSLGSRGIVAMALAMSWGPSKQIITINAGDKVETLLGYDITDSKLLLVNEALKRAKTLLLYRLNVGTKATATVGSLTATAKYGGLRGNDLKIVIQTNIDDNSKFDVSTLLAGVEVNKQTVANIAGLTPNDWVVWSGTGSLTATAGAALTSGADGSVVNSDHTDFLAAIEVQEFTTIALTSTDSGLKAVYASFVERLRDDEGVKIQVVMENYHTADYEGVISVKNGVVLADGTTLTAAQAVAWVAGATAAAEVNESLTRTAYDGAVDVNPRYTNSQIEAALVAGDFLFTQSQGRALVEQDINSYTSFTPDKDRRFAKNRVLRVLDAINNDLKRICDSYYLGKVDNDDDGRNLLKNEYVKYLEGLQSIGALQNFDSKTDITIAQGEDSDAVYAEYYVQPVDAIEKIYNKVWVK